MRVITLRAMPTIRHQGTYTHPLQYFKFQVIINSIIYPIPFCPFSFSTPIHHHVIISGAFETSQHPLPGNIPEGGPTLSPIHILV